MLGIQYLIRNNMSPDITACVQEDCTKKKTCYRYTCDKDLPWQSFFASDPRTKKGRGYTCGYYWNINYDKLPKPK